MFSSPTIVVGLEIGTSKICAMVGEVDKSGALRLIGVGQAKSRGVRKGEIVDASPVEEDVRKAIADAEEMADVEIRSVFLGITGDHILGSNNRGVHTVLSQDREIDADDVQKVTQNARAATLPPGHHIIHAIRQYFVVDGQEGVVDPVGFAGRRLEVDLHLIHGNLDRLRNSINLVNTLQLEVDNIVFNGLAANLALLSPEEKDLGALVIDLGAGTTDFVLCRQGVIRHSGVLAVGGDHVTNDLAIGLKIPLHRAEWLKTNHGSALADPQARGQSIPGAPDAVSPEKPVNLEHLQRIMSVRLEEVFTLIARELGAAGLLDHLHAGVFLCGGGSRTPGLAALAEQIFQSPAVLGHAHAASGLQSTLDQPEFAVPIGLVKFGAMNIKQQRDRRRPWWRPPWS
ncbi:MAG TPA: cell division protein FtsA [Candidatus Paceibacterota bacterium]|nr:cell division protein FtsA [Verrucomicrobiota bacterium]HOX01178.1 cell division protein FtsA [Verrucomicrobiota bacterium]HRZ45760.1 cell division protein FtsA [Candidatus Paceibacterota bacterium]HRZ93640.1 cell division protein FtsA [Candidatus Paceibacterota bacterium]